MLRRNVAKGLVAILVMATSLSIVLVPSAMSAPEDEAGIVSSSEMQTQAQADAAVAYWTPERMAAAVPMPMPVLTGGSVIEPAVAKPAVAGPAVLIAGNAPGTKANTTPVLVSPAALAVPSVFSYYSYPPPFDRTSVPPTISPTYPWQTIGKLFFTQSGTNYVCSGTSTVSTNQRVVMTAGHCLNAGGSNGTTGAWSTNVVFCPAWYRGMQKGCWGYITLYSFTEWTQYSNHRRDVGAIKTADTPYLTGVQIHEIIGSQGFAYNFGPQNGGLPQLWWAMGYPQSSPFNGTQMITCQGSLFKTDAVNGRPGPDTNGIGCDMTGGSSGGGWIYQFRMGVSGFLNGHNDYKYTSPSWPSAMFSPHFDTDVNTLREAAGAGS